MKSPIALLCALFKDITRAHTRVKGLDRDLVTIESRFGHEGHSFLSVALPALCDAFDEGVSTGRFTCPPGFGKVRGVAIPKLFSGMLCEVFDPFTGDLKEDVDLTMVKTIRETLRLFKKLSLSNDREDILDRKGKEEFFSNDEKNLQEIPEDHFTYRLRYVCRLVLPHLDLLDFRELPVKHGPGAVFEGYTPNQKWLGILSAIDKLEDFGMDTFQYAMHAGNGHNESPRVPSKASPGSSAKLCTVAKSSTSRRTITIEPCARQFVQQGLNILLRDSIARCKILSNCLSLTDQSINQKLALIGSQTDEWSTIDLKSASDLLSLRVVEYIFRDKPLFLAGMLEARSPTVYDGKVHHELLKFAGMGNATTFPVQSVVFACIAITAALGDSRLSYRNVMRASRSVRVYGDDIIVRRSDSHVVVSGLQKLGLTVNLRKSFLEGNFKESCGVDAFRGVDVTPLYVRHLPDSTSRADANAIAHLVEFSNQAWLRGLYSMSTYVKDEVERLIGRPLPLVSSTTGALGWHTRRGDYDIGRYHKTLHRNEIFAPVLIPSYRRDKIDGYAALLKSFLVPLLGRPTGHLEKSQIRYKTRPAQSWINNMSKLER
jgi:hypothetical protein